MARAAAFCCAACVGVLVPGGMTPPMGTCMAERWPRMDVGTAVDAGCGTAIWFIRFPSGSGSHGTSPVRAIKTVCGGDLQPHRRQRAQQLAAVVAGDDAAIEDGHGP